jgi:hypothetical protein
LSWTIAQRVDSREGDGEVLLIERLDQLALGLLVVGEQDLPPPEHLPDALLKLNFTPPLLCILGQLALVMLGAGRELSISASNASLKPLGLRLSMARSMKSWGVPIARSYTSTEPSSSSRSHASRSLSVQLDPGVPGPRLISSVSAEVIAKLSRAVGGLG